MCFSVILDYFSTLGTLWFSQVARGACHSMQLVNTYWFACSFSTFGPVSKRICWLGRKPGSLAIC